MAEQQRQHQPQHQHEREREQHYDTVSDHHSSLSRTNSAVRRARPPPRNQEGDMCCDHPNCRNSNQIFRRMCEWNKHMDRHERPYKCLESGCELNPGFTYSGGLLRHQREVHKMHLSTKQPLFCPFANCNRSSGVGFTRKENLEEHKRRRHLDEIETSDYVYPAKSGAHRPTTASIPIPAPEHSQQEVSSPSSKRRKVSTTSESQSGHTVAMASHMHVATTVAGSAAVAIGAPEMTTQTPTQMQTTATTTPTQQLVQRLRDELLRKEDLIRRQSAEILRLQNFLRSLPPQMVFEVLQSQAQAQAQHAQQAPIPGGDGG
ncbi:hypothetical protein A1O3_10188 [Capronia epimyces CBS 606.96]|uniref:C2H2-type domain-containing protein n=1 Tax=Capronia epimyces CBS 606.96 TaxID=1182542 RepID=W9XJ80_9EURO|nr:uncharacterized protein A1O3_10188 [Capronia epimyces CBS 606.96]EXJ77031.1 hypothetical protein A1O3_10188 [Capronia epimyces CBS 606.96]